MLKGLDRKLKVIEGLLKFGVFGINSFRVFSMIEFMYGYKIKIPRNINVIFDGL